ncbi:MAG: type II toxin-antitoxin system RelE/ParE family toxin [Victivallales bacterium]
MVLWLVHEGIKFTVYSMEDVEDSKNLRHFLEELKAQDDDEHERAIERIKRLGDHGPSFNTQQFRSLGDGLFELKTKKGTRITFFYDEFARHVVICTQGFDKKTKKVQSNQIKIARSLRAMFTAIRSSGEKIRIIITDDSPEPKRLP